MKQQFISKCQTTGYYIEFIIDVESKSALMGTIVCDYVYFKAFLNLLRLSVDNLTKQNIKKIRQKVPFDEWKSYLENKTSWLVIDINNDIYELECDINHFLENYGIAIGMLDTDQTIF